MKFGINCKYDELLKKEIVSGLKQKEIKFVEIRKPPENINYDELKIIKGQFEYSMHASFEDLKIKLFPKLHYSIEGVKKAEKDIDLAIELGVKEVVVHAGPFFKGYVRISKILKRNIGLNYFLDLFIKTFGPIFQKAQSNNIKIMIENSYPCFLLGRPYDIAYIKQKLPFLGICLDIGHSEIYSQTEDLMKLGIDHIHITDNNKKTDQHLIVGNGSIDFNDFFKKLKAQDYNKKVIFECEEIEDSISSYNKIKSMSV